eukprot:CAMPEP_0181199504 /NCGR_PEP_ID=MMETSP1096-20121128/17207_1 /TAXON_ID=156174 ORGANISM="Chrysochromulina ericina, Strain CCMP281" /NCGR_SAMPLE_ID=MMETSP1096 /ASSEMBLY_ACC=CAM_ASM_000453 /LENGTH=142 /DNA_ID=CAMNT_0023289681 /DNA_START=901 /DNA_END=1329 /DNA_ORIENTATION=+
MAPATLLQNARKLLLVAAAPRGALKAAGCAVAPQLDHREAPWVGAQIDHAGVDINCLLAERLWVAQVQTYLQVRCCGLAMLQQPRPWVLMECNINIQEEHVESQCEHAPNDSRLECNSRRVLPARRAFVGVEQILRKQLHIC